MSHSILHDSRLYAILWRIDRDLAASARQVGCPICGGALHSARYPRKPRCPVDLGPEHRWRWSFCCAEDGCRRRTTPASVRFLGQRVYLATVVVLVTALRQGPTPPGSRVLNTQLGVDRKTLDRWQKWWREEFVDTRFWKAARSRFHPPVSATAIPRSLLDRFASGDETERLIALLKFIAPISTATGVAS